MVAKKYATKKEAEEARRERERIRRKRLRAEQAIAAGRLPGARGAPIRRIGPEAEARRRILERYRNAHREERRKKDREQKQADRHALAVSMGREPGRIGRVRIFSDEERRERARQVTLRWGNENPDKRKALARRYYLANKDKVAAKVRNRQLAKIAAGSYKPSDIHDLWEAQKRKCVFCLKGIQWGKFDIDHHVPLSRGGSNDRSNLRLLHPRCNRSKGARDPADHALRNGLLCW